MPLDNYFVKGILMGIVFGVPAGAVGVLTVRNTLEGGFLSGLLTGLGSSAADLIYAVATIFGIRLISDFMIRERAILGIGGGVVIAGMGVLVLLGGKGEGEREKSSLRLAGQFATAFLIALMNPATVLSFIAAFAGFGISGRLPAIRGIQLTGGILAGTLLWWLALSGIVSLFRERLSRNIFGILNPVLGCLLIILGSLLLYGSLFQRGGM